MKRITRLCWFLYVTISLYFFIIVVAIWQVLDLGQPIKCKYFDIKETELNLNITYVRKWCIQYPEFQLDRFNQFGVEINLVKTMDRQTMIVRNILFVLIKRTKLQHLHISITFFLCYSFFWLGLFMARVSCRSLAEIWLSLSLVGWNV